NLYSLDAKVRQHTAYNILRLCGRLQAKLVPFHTSFSSLASAPFFSPLIRFSLQDPQMLQQDLAADQHQDDAPCQLCLRLVPGPEYIAYFNTDKRDCKCSHADKTHRPDDIYREK